MPRSIFESSISKIENKFSRKALILLSSLKATIVGSCMFSLSLLVIPQTWAHRTPILSNAHFHLEIEESSLLIDAMYCLADFMQDLISAVTEWIETSDGF